MSEGTFEFERELYEKLGPAAEHETVVEALEFFWSIVENKDIDEEPTSISVNQSRDRDINMVDMVVTWASEADPEDEDPDYLWSELSITLAIDMKDHVFSWTLNETVEGGTGTVFDIEDVMEAIVDAVENKD